MRHRSFACLDLDDVTGIFMGPWCPRWGSGLGRSAQLLIGCLPLVIWFTLKGSGIQIIGYHQGTGRGLPWGTERVEQGFRPVSASESFPSLCHRWLS